MIELWTRPTAALYAVLIFFATLLVHAGDFIRLAPHGGWTAELNVFYIGSAIAAVPLAAGWYSMSGSRGRLD